MKNFTPEIYHHEILAFSLAGGNFADYVDIRRGLGNRVERTLFHNLSVAQNISTFMNNDAKNKHPANTS